MPPSPEQIGEYSGKLIEQIEQQVVSAEQSLVCPVGGEAAALMRQCFDKVNEITNDYLADEMLARDPILVLAAARFHLTNKEMTAGDVQAWFLVHDVQNCLWSGATEICVRVGCGQMEGIHPREGCCGFVSMGTSYQVALRSACSERLRGEV